MPGHSMGANHKPPSHHTSRTRAESYGHSRSCSRDSGTSQDSPREHHSNNNLLSSSSGGGSSNHHYSKHKNHSHHHNHNHSHGHHHRSQSEGRKTHSRHTNGRGSETIGFIPGSADAAQGVPPACGSCASLGWSGCKALICCILTCGFYGTREPCLPVHNESSTDNPPAKSSEAEIQPLGNGMALTNPTCGVPLEARKPERELPNSDSFRYKDVRIAGKKVHYQPGPAKRNNSAAKSGGQKERTSSIYSREDLDLDDIDDSKADIDSLITKKLLDLYKLHQIEQLAKCTSDSSFSRKTNEISDLIYSIAQDYNLEEQEAECRLVHGVIRISTRKGKNKNSYGRNKDSSSQDALLHLNGQRDGTLPDSGHETMTLTFSSFEPEVKVSDLTPSDELARRMRVHSGRTYSSSSATVYSPTSHDTYFSGSPLLHSP
ncbi:keratinocyte differentiation factor 1 [Alosa sapidissima]|uniref:keratinocyte differentiation factor 1 n=1 Tax=Alosa sapidissima TaxID=34773 RepID=UPI001C08B16E|nr:keratinocyte differentiation factor 1 [Alosa sapidissima]